MSASSVTVTSSVGCPLCVAPAVTLWEDDRLYVIEVDDEHQPGMCRVIWRQHVAEMTELTPEERRHFMAVVWGVEAALRDVLVPHKINLASLGNQVPHLHWHVIPRWQDDPCFPGAIWAEPIRPGGDRSQARAALPRLRQQLREALALSFDRT